MTIIHKTTGVGRSEHRTYKDGEPCAHPGCLNHVSHPCEGCGRTAGRGTVIKKGLAVGKSETSVDIETTPDGGLYSIAEWHRQFGKASVLDALREALRADRPPLERLFLMLADEGLVPPITHVAPRMFDLFPYQVKLMEAMRRELREGGWVHFSSPTGRGCCADYPREASMYHEQGRSMGGTVTGRFTNHTPHFEELPRPWLDDYMTTTADAFSALLVPKPIFADDVDRIVAPKNKPWYQKFDKKRRF